MTPITETITLDAPIQRGDQLINTVSIRKPMAGELRGVSLMAIMQMDVSAIIHLLPRVTTPSLTTQEVERMDPADLLQLTTTVTSFLLPKSAITAFPSASSTPSQTLQ